MSYKSVLCLLVVLPLVPACRGASAAKASGAARAPTVCPTPRAAEPNELQVDFTGVLLFKRGLPPDPPFRVIIPNIGHSHLAYIQYLEDDLAAPPDGFNAPDDLPKCCGRNYVLLVNHNLAIAGDDEPGNLQEGTVDQFLPHLRDISGVGKLNPNFDKSEPTTGFVAAQMDLTRGRLTPLLPEDKKAWLFKHGGEVYKKDVACLAQGVRLRLALKPGSTVRITTTKGTATLSLKARNDGPTLVRIGNSLPSDILCPEPTADKDDPHFAHLYKVLEKKPATEWIPAKTDQDCFAAPPPQAKARTAGTVGIFSHGGSNCIPAQMP